MTADQPSNFNILLFFSLALLFGILMTLPIGGADMPVIISLLNSYSGLAACAAGFAINNNILIVAGSLVGASGIILTNIMCKAMNRTLGNVLFSGFGAAGGLVELAIELHRFFGIETSTAQIGRWIVDIDPVSLL